MTDKPDTAAIRAMADALPRFIATRADERLIRALKSNDTNGGHQ